MYYKAELAFRSQVITCIVLRNAVDEYLVGRIEAFDQCGIVLFNIDYRGIATCHVYISMDEIEDIVDKPCYLDKIKVLFDAAKSDKENINLIHNTELKKDFLKWIYENKKKIEITLEDEQFEGYIYRISAEYTDVNVIDKETETDEGHVILRNEYLFYFSVDM